jgi:hypothetical protein
VAVVVERTRLAALEQRVGLVVVALVLHMELQMVVMAALILAAAAAVLVEEPDKILVLAVLAVLALQLFATYPQLKKVLAVRLHLLVVITTIPSHLLALTHRKGKSYVTFCKSSRRHRYTSYRC